MYILLVIIHVLACLGLILIVLLQRGKGADLGAAFGGSSQTVFGSQGAGGFLARLTTISAVVFMVTCLTLAYLSFHRVQATIMEKTEQASRAVPAEVEEGAGVAETAASAGSGAEEQGTAQGAPTDTAAEPSAQGAAGQAGSGAAGEAGPAGEGK